MNLAADDIGDGPDLIAATLETPAAATDIIPAALPHRPAGSRRAPVLAVVPAEASARGLPPR